MKLRIDGKENNPILPRAVEPLLADADVSDLRVLVYAALCDADGRNFEPNDAAEVLALSESEVRSSVKFWRGAGLLGVSRRQPDAKKTDEDARGDAAEEKKSLREKRRMRLNAAELCRVADENAEFRTLLDAAQQTAGWIFNESEIEIVAALYSSLKLSGEFILSLIGYFICKKEKPLRYVETVAYDLFDKGITEPKALEEWLRKREIAESNEGIVRRLFGLGARALTGRESTALNIWFDEYGYGEEMISLAYEKTIHSAGKPSIAYAASILRAWHEAGYKTPADVENAKSSRKSAGKQGGKQPQSFDADDFFEQALRRSYGGTGDKT